MNWNKIKEQYPKALKEFMLWDFEDNETDFEEWVDTAWWLINKRNIRDLYDFFDEQGIYISIRYDNRWENPDSTDSEVINYWDWDIDDSLNNLGSSQVEEPTRTEAEEKAFEKAFEILESKVA